MVQQHSDSEIWEAREVFLAVMNNLPKQIVKYDDCRAQPHCLSNEDLPFNFRFYTKSVWQDLVYEADRPVLLWLLGEGLKWGSPKVTWPMLLRFLGGDPAEEDKWKLYESALRIAATSVQVHYHYRVAGNGIPERRKQTFAFVRRYKLAATAPKQEEGPTDDESSQAFKSIFCKQIAFELDSGLLTAAQWAFNRNTLQFEGISKPSSEASPLFSKEAVASEATCGRF